MTMRLLTIGFVAAFLSSAAVLAATDTAQRSEAMTTAPAAANLHDLSGVYPPASRRRGEEGQVTVSFVVGIDGRVSAPRVVHSSGFARLDKAALAAVSAWTYQPARRGGVPFATNHTVRLDFRLHDTRAAPSGPAPNANNEHRRAAMANPFSWQLLAEFPALGAAAVVLGLPFLAAVLSLYFIPALVAVHRAHPRALRVFLLNLLAGWTILGWIGALVWAVRGSNPYPHFA